MRNFKTYDLAVEFYRLCQPLPLKGHLREQLTRASISIPLNLAEGRGKSSRRDQLRFFHIAMGSLRECQAIFDLGQLKNSEAYTKLDCLAAHLYRLIKRAH